MQLQFGTPTMSKFFQFCRAILLSSPGPSSSPLQYMSALYQVLLCVLYQRLQLPTLNLYHDRSARYLPFQYSSNSCLPSKFYELLQAHAGVHQATTAGGSYCSPESFSSSQSSITSSLTGGPSIADCNDPAEGGHDTGSLTMDTVSLRCRH